MTPQKVSRKAGSTPGSLRNELKAVARLLPPTATMAFVRSHVAPGGGEWIDDAWDLAQAQVAKKLKLADPGEALDHPFIIASSYAMDNPGRYGAKGVPLQHTLTATSPETPLVAAAFREVFGRRVQWSGRREDTIIVWPK